MILASNSPVANRWLWRIIVGSVLVIPMVVSPTGKDSFRLPKELVFRAEAILIVSTCVALLLLKKLRRPTDWRDPALVIPAVAVLWSLISMLASTNRTVSGESFLWIAGWAAIFVATCGLARRRRFPAVYVAMIPAIINAAVVLLQESGLWNPFFPGRSSEHVYHSGLVGNANDAGTFFVVPAVASFALIFLSKSHRLAHVAVTLFLLVAAVANHTLTALVAIFIGLLATVFVVARRWAAGAFVAMLLLAISMVRYYPPLHFRYDLAIRFMRGGYYDSILSGRTLPYATAFQMFLDRPMTGVGPGCFKWEYFPYKLRVSERYANLKLSGTTVNYGEVHSDHLQILAETGLPGYVLFVTALIVIGSTPFVSTRSRSPEQNLEARFSTVASFPLAIAFAVVATGQFPLELAASTAVTIYLFALCRAWRPASTRVIGVSSHD